MYNRRHFLAGHDQWNNGKQIRFVIFNLTQNVQEKSHNWR